MCIDEQNAASSRTHKPKHSRLMSTLMWAVIGAVIGNMSATPTNEAMNWAWESWLHGQAHLDKGKSLRRAAIEERDPSKHVLANIAFMRSAAGGVEEATAFIGQAFCFGWGFPKIPDIGQQMINDAIKRDPRIASIWSHDPDVCPQTTR